MLLKLFFCLSLATLILAVSSQPEAQPRTALSPLDQRMAQQARSPELAQAAGVAVNMEIISACSNGVATFKIVNIGERWPAMGTLEVVQMVDGQQKLLSKRQMRFAQGQKASFRMKHPGSGALGLFVNPSWYKRPFELDAEVTCE